jgi:hypothetical protein
MNVILNVLARTVIRRGYSLLQLTKPFRVGLPVEDLLLLLLLLLWGEETMTGLLDFIWHADPRYPPHITCFQSTRKHSHARKDTPYPSVITVDREFKARARNYRTYLLQAVRGALGCIWLAYALPHSLIPLFNLYSISTLII